MSELRPVETNPQAPPPAPPVEVRKRTAVGLNSVQGASAPVLYSIGEPSDEEQLFLELINRARANPLEEGLLLKATDDSDIIRNYNFFNVDLDRMVEAFRAIDPVSPLAMNARLSAAARLHSMDMFKFQYQGHFETNGNVVTAPNDRTDAQGYDALSTAENVFTTVRSVFYGHAGFEVDWGGSASSGGMQDPPGHRRSIHDPFFREAGMGVVLGTNGKVGPMLVTQDFGTQQDDTPFITGVVYYDLNGNGFYDPAEGLAGVTVNVSGAKFFAVSANSGGYTVPIPGNGQYTVTLSAPGLTQKQVVVGVTDGQNVKIDFVPPYSPPVVSGPATPSVGHINNYQFSATGGATAYQWRHAQQVPYTTVEGAEDGLANVTPSISAGYEVIITGTKASGTHSFHLAMPAQQVQILTLNRSVRPSAQSKLEFQSLLALASFNQVAKAQISLDGGATWQDVWTQAGDNTTGETKFSLRSISLSPFAGQTLSVRFIYDLGGPFFSGTGQNVGILIDDIRITAAEEMVNKVVTDVANGNAFAFNPPADGDYVLQVRPKISNRFFDWGPALTVSAQTGPAIAPSVRISGIRWNTGGQVQMDFDLTVGTALLFSVQSAPSPLGPWTKDNAASIQSITSAKFHVATSAGNAAQLYYQVVAP